MKPNLFIRADGNSKIGFGHVIRCTALAEIFRDNFSCTFLIQKPTAFLINEIKKSGAKFIILPETENYIEEAIELEKKYINTNDIIVLDGYNFETEYQKRIKKSNCKIICIDDIHAYHFIADIIINHSPSSKKSDYSVEPYTKLFLGLEYSLLRKAFRQEINCINDFHFSNIAFVCFGGSDPFGLTIQTLKILKYKNIEKINVVIGDGFKDIKSLTHYCNDNGVIIHKSISSTEMVSLIKKSGFAIVPSSSIILELFTIGLPIITGYYIDNQKETSEEIHKMGLAYSCENMLINYQSKLSQLLINISDLNKNKIMIQNQKNIFSNTENGYIKIIKNI